MADDEIEVRHAELGGSCMRARHTGDTGKNSKTSNGLPSALSFSPTFPNMLSFERCSHV